jgi:site-specific DNA recombinase
MTPCFAYIRVSTVRQGEQGVSLQEQRTAIENYATRNGLAVHMWFEEMLTASKRGRPAFTKMMKLLQKGAVKGVIIHKIDRGARNLRDWSDIRDLSDAGIAVHFANEGVDLNSRGGRLSADIQAVVSADFIYNLREETKKGMYGRLKQGLLPLSAPLGYLNMGKGKVKEVDPLRSPLIREAFEEYATGKHNLRTLADYLYGKGLRGRTGRKVGINSLSIVLNNPFYVGIIRMKRSGKTFDGIHEPLISRSLFDLVQHQLRGKSKTVVRSHDFLFRRLLHCGSCGNSLVGERQKGHVYYRCHTYGCAGGCIREEIIEDELASLFSQLRFSVDEKCLLDDCIQAVSRDVYKEAKSSRQALALQLDQIAHRLARLTDAYLDQAIERDLFEERQKALLFDKKEIEGRIRTERDEVDLKGKVKDLLELANSASLSYFLADLPEKRNLVETLTSNRELHGKKLDIRLSIPYLWIAERESVLTGSLERDTSRSQGHSCWTTNSPAELLNQILKWLCDANNTPS